MTNKLKPCPFCGGEAAVFGKSKTRVCCSNDDCVASDTFEGVLHQGWNTRTSGWISIDDELPANDNQYIAWVGERSIVLFYCDDGYWCEHYGARDYSKYVTHWMPLPQPPTVQAAISGDIHHAFVKQIGNGNFRAIVRTKAE